MSHYRAEPAEEDPEPATFEDDDDAAEAWRQGQEVVGRLGLLIDLVQEEQIAEELREMAERVAKYFP